MDRILTQLRACAEPSRLRLLALCAKGSFCASELTEIMGQSQPRLSRHLRLLVEAGVLECSREGAHAWFSLAPGEVAEAVLRLLPRRDPAAEADARAASRIVAERSRSASAEFREQGAGWDEMRALGLPVAKVDSALMLLLGADRGLGDVLDLGTGTGRLLEVLAPHARQCLGIDASPAMLALARGRLAGGKLRHCKVRRADAYRLPLASRSQDVVLAQMLLHHAEDPPAMLAEAARVLRPEGLLVVVDLDAAMPDASLGRLRWPGFSNADMRQMMRAAGLAPRPGAAIAGAPTVRLWPARLAEAAIPAGRVAHAAERAA